MNWLGGEMVSDWWAVGRIGAAIAWVGDAV